MPPGPARSPRRAPTRVLALLVRLPKRKVESILLQRGRPRLLALIHVLGTPVGELPVIAEALDAEVDIAAGLVRVARPDEVGDQDDDPADRFRRQRLRIGAA